MRTAWNKRHGMSDSPIYRVWRAMLNRCCNPSNKSYHDYGGRGIAVCERWQLFDNFYADMGPRPDGAEIDRVDNDGSYSPENCQWTTRATQASNKRNNLLLTANGKTQHLAAWARELGINPAAILYRLNKGWSVERAVTQPGATRPNSKLTGEQASEIRRLYPEVNSPKLAAKFGVDKATILDVIHRRTFADVP